MKIFFTLNSHDFLIGEVFDLLTYLDSDLVLQAFYTLLSFILEYLSPGLNSNYSLYKIEPQETFDTLDSVNLMRKFYIREFIEFESKVRYLHYQSGTVHAS